VVVVVVEVEPSFEPLVVVVWVVAVVVGCEVVVDGVVGCEIVVDGVVGGEVVWDE
jgi:hypothetical protein